MEIKQREADPLLVMRRVLDCSSNEGHTAKQMVPKWPRRAHGECMPKQRRIKDPRTAPPPHTRVLPLVVLRQQQQQQPFGSRGLGVPVLVPISRGVEAPSPTRVAVKRCSNSKSQNWQQPRIPPGVHVRMNRPDIPYSTLSTRLTAYSLRSVLPMGWGCLPSFPVDIFYRMRP